MQSPQKEHAWHKRKMFERQKEGYGAVAETDYKLGVER